MTQLWAAFVLACVLYSYMSLPFGELISKPQKRKLPLNFKLFISDVVAWLSRRCLRESI